MSLVVVKPKFQVTIPAKLRGSIGLQEGDVLDAVLVEEGILLRPQVVIDHGAVAERLEALLSASRGSTADAGRPEAEVVEDVIEEIKAARRQRRGR